jgi:arylsulfatase A-like enzyme
MRTWPFRDYEPVPGAPWVYGWQPIPEGQTTLAQMLKEQGYKSPMMVTDTYHQWVPSMNFFRGFDLYQFVRGQTADPYRPAWMAPQGKLERTMMKGGPGILARMRQYYANTAGRQTEKDWFPAQVFTGASQLLEAATRKQPFFLTVDCYDPHEPWDPPKEYVRMYDPEPYSGPEPHQPTQGPSDYLTERELKRMRAWYAGELSMMDRWLGRFLEKAQEMGLFENTLIVLLGDHGHLLGEHGYVGKVHTELYPELVEIPFMIRHPEGVGAGGDGADGRAGPLCAAGWPKAPRAGSLHAGLQRLGVGQGREVRHVLAQRRREREALRPEARPNHARGHSLREPGHSEEHVRGVRLEGRWWRALTDLQREQVAPGVS